METWLVILIIGQLAFVAAIIAIAARYRTQKARLRVDERSRLLERFESSEDLQHFLESEAGRELFGRAQASPVHPGKAVLGAFSAGIICLMLGGGFMILWRAKLVGFDDVFLIPAVLTVAAAIGILLSAAASVFLSRGLGGHDGDDG